jgi:hypothetical protein
MVENLWFGGTEVCSELSTTTATTIYKDCNDEPSQARNWKSERKGGALHQRDDSGGKHNKQQQQQQKHQQKKGVVEDVKMAGLKTFELAGALQVGIVLPVWLIAHTRKIHPCGAQYRNT